MKGIIIRMWIFPKSIIFSYKCENNTFRKTVEEAVRRKISLAFADLSGAILKHTILCNTNLSGANLEFADLKYSILSDANLLGAKLWCAELYKTDLTDAKIDYPMGLPEGEFIAWKKVRDYIIKLKIFEDSKRSRATTDKCRCDKALVLEIQNLDGSKSDLMKVTNNNFKRCTYKVGEIVKADSWDENRFNECSHGIHFFLDRELAVNYAN